MENNDYLNTLKLISVIFISVYCLSNMLYAGSPSHSFLFSLVQCISNMAFPLLLMVFGAEFINKHTGVFEPVKSMYRLLLPSFVLFSAILGILIIYFDGFNSLWLIAKYNWFNLLLLTYVLILPVLNEFIKWENESGIKYILVLFIITSIFWCMSIYFDFSLYYIDLVFFSSPACFMVLGYYMSKYDFKINLNILSLIFIVLLLIKAALCYVGLNESYIILLKNITLPIIFDPVVILSLSALFLIFKKYNFKLNNKVKLISDNCYTAVLILSIFTYVLSNYLFH